MSYQFPESKNTPMMTSPAILEWLSGEIEDVNALKEKSDMALERGIYAAIAGYLQNMHDRFAETMMRAMDGDTTAARQKLQP